MKKDQPHQPAATVLVVDDDRDFRQIVRRDLEGRGYAVQTASTGEKALETLDRETIDIVLLDYRLPGKDGLAVLERIRAVHSDIDVVMITSHGSIPTAVEAMKHGAAEYIMKPFIPDEVAKILSNLVERQDLIKQNERLRELLNERWGVESIKGRSVHMRRIREQIRRLAESTVTVLITGESGTGKELVARALHITSPRSGGLFVAVNAAGLPPALAESEFFGHKRGAFTSADRDKDGLFVAADGGTIFLDEVAEMPLELQSKLLRAIETLEIRPVGGEEPRKVNVRIICATNRNLEEEVAAGRFREDLFYRINVVHIHILPLRERIEDVSELVEHFLAAKRGDKPIKGFTSEAMNALEAYSWPGNAREIENAVERAVALVMGEVIDIGDLPRQVAHAGEIFPYQQATGHAADAAGGLSVLTLGEVERITVLRAMEAAGGEKSHAARILGINRATLYRKLKNYGVTAGEERGSSSRSVSKSQD